MKYKHVIDVLTEYTLDILDPEEMARVRSHLQVCSACSDELRALEAAADRLAFTVPQVTPPPALKAKIMRAAAETLPQERKSGTQTIFERLSDAFKRFSPAWNVVSLLLIIVLGASTILLWQQLQEKTSQTEVSFVTITLAGTENAPDASGLIVVPAHELDGTLIIDHLMPLADDLQYQLWLIRDGVRASGAVFSVDSQGYGMVRLQLPDSIDTYDSFGITVEPKGGSPLPTGDKVLGGTF